MSLPEASRSRRPRLPPAGPAAPPRSGEVELVVASDAERPRGQDAYVRGTLLPRASARIVRLERLAGGKWRQVDADVTDGTGRYALRHRARAADTAMLRVRFGGDQTADRPERVAGRLNVYRPALASWYGPGLYGNRLGCGGTLNAGTVGVAHKSLPCGTRVVLRKRLARRPRPRDRPRALTSAPASSTSRPRRSTAPAVRLGRPRLGRALARVRPSAAVRPRHSVRRIGLRSASDVRRVGDRT